VNGSVGAVTAAAAAKVDFNRTAVTTKGDPDGKLKQLLSAQSLGTITRAASAGTLDAPLDQLVTASPFGYRVSPITGGAGEFHRGQDFAAQCGTAVHAAASGTVTFKSAKDLREVAAMVPLERMLIETDSPYLAPVPHRGKPNSSYLMAHTVRFVAERKGVALAELCTALAANATAVFGPWGEEGTNG